MFPSPYGVWIATASVSASYPPAAFPSPYGVWIATGVLHAFGLTWGVSVPLRGVDCYLAGDACQGLRKFPSPYGVWIATATFI